MFGYVTINKPEMKFKEFDEYRAFYCGLCENLRKKYGYKGAISLSYEATFLVILLTSLYEKDTQNGKCRCIVHPLEKHPIKENEFTEYAADMTILLSYYKCMDDWVDEKKLEKLTYANTLKSAFRKIESKYPEKAKVMEQYFAEISKLEKENNQDIDQIAGTFGKIVAELFVYKKDEWEEYLEKMGFFLGKFIYLCDAYEDVEKDLKSGNYNPFKLKYQNPQFEDECRNILTMMMSECSKEFEMLPILQNVEILRNIIYSGVWMRYKMVYTKRHKDENN